MSGNEIASEPSVIRSGPVLRVRVERDVESNDGRVGFAVEIEYGGDDAGKILIGNLLDEASRHLDAEMAAQS